MEVERVKRDEFHTVVEVKEQVFCETAYHSHVSDQIEQ